MHIDCDIYSAVAYCYDVSKGALVRGGYILLDDPVTASYLRALEAVEAYMIQRDRIAHGNGVTRIPYSASHRFVVCPRGLLR